MLLQTEVLRKLAFDNLMVNSQIMLSVQLLLPFQDEEQWASKVIGAWNFIQMSLWITCCSLYP